MKSYNYIYIYTHSHIHTAAAFRVQFPTVSLRTLVTRPPFPLPPFPMTRLKGIPRSSWQPETLGAEFSLWGPLDHGGDTPSEKLTQQIYHLVI